MDAAILKGVCSNVIFPASTFARSSISLMSTINESPLIFMALKYSFCFNVKSVFNSTFVNPIIAFMGVRISWLMLDKNCCFDFTAFSAISVALSALLCASSAIFVALSALLFDSMAIFVASSANTFASTNSFSNIF